MNKRKLTALFAACAMLCGCGNGQAAGTTTAAPSETTTAAFSEGTGTTVEYIPFTELSYREQAERII